ALHVASEGGSTVDARKRGDALRGRALRLGDLFGCRPDRFNPVRGRGGRTWEPGSKRRRRRDFASQRSRTSLSALPSRDSPPCDVCQTYIAIQASMLRAPVNALLTHGHPAI